MLEGGHDDALHGYANALVSKVHFISKLQSALPDLRKVQLVLYKQH
jgi:hypothetical protein